MIRRPLSGNRSRKIAGTRGSLAPAKKRLGMSSRHCSISSAERPPLKPLRRGAARRSSHFETSCRVRQEISPKPIRTTRWSFIGISPRRRGPPRGLKERRGIIPRVCQLRVELPEVPGRLVMGSQGGRAARTRRTEDLLELCHQIGNVALPVERHALWPEVRVAGDDGNPEGQGLPYRDGVAVGERGSND